MILDDGKSFVSEEEKGKNIKKVKKKGKQGRGMNWTIFNLHMKTVKFYKIKN